MELRIAWILCALLALPLLQAEDPSVLSIAQLFDAGGQEDAEGASPGRAWAAQELFRRAPADVFAEAKKRLSEPARGMLTQAFSIHAIDQLCPQRVKELPLEILRGLDARGKHQLLVHLWNYPAPEYRALMLDVLRDWNAWMDGPGALTCAAMYFNAQPHRPAAELLERAFAALKPDAQEKDVRLRAGFPFIPLASDLTGGESLRVLMERAVANCRSDAAQPLTPFAFTLTELDVLPQPAKATRENADAWVRELKDDATADGAARNLLLQASLGAAALLRAQNPDVPAAQAQRIALLLELGPVVHARRELLRTERIDMPEKEMSAYDAALVVCSSSRLDGRIKEHGALLKDVRIGGANIPRIEPLMKVIASVPSLRLEPSGQVLTNERGRFGHFALHNATAHSVANIGILWAVHGREYHYFRCYALNRAWIPDITAEFVAERFILPNGAEIPGRIFQEQRWIQRNALSGQHALDQLRAQGGRARVAGSLRLNLPLRANVAFVDGEGLQRAGDGTVNARYTQHLDYWGATATLEIPVSKMVREFEPLVSALDADGKVVNVLTTDGPHYVSVIMGTNLVMKCSSTCRERPARMRVVYFTQSEERWIPTELEERKILEAE